MDSVVETLVYVLFIPYSTLYMVLWVNTTNNLLVEIMLQMFPSYDEPWFLRLVSAGIHLTLM